jgi:hypothetical protein
MQQGHSRPAGRAHRSAPPLDAGHRRVEERAAVARETAGSPRRSSSEISTGAVTSPSMASRHAGASIAGDDMWLRT